MNPCKVCNNVSNNKFHQIREMQLGLREVFTYMECGNCGCMQIVDIPADLGKYYPNEGYYSFNLGLDVRKKPDSLRKAKADYLIYGKNKLLGGLLSVGYKAPEYYSWMKNSGVKYDDAILDVGTGNGSLLASLFRIGYTDLTGIDPFINEDHLYGSVNIYKKDIFQMTGQFDLIMLHHAFEHMDEPLKVLNQLFKLLKPGKCLIIRTPVMGMYSWQNYGVNWMDLDAPRHIIIHTLKSMSILAQQAGFELRKTIFDGNYMSLIGSELYARDVALPEQKMSMLSKEEIEKFKEITKNNDESGQSDQAAFYLFRPK